MEASTSENSYLDNDILESLKIPQLKDYLRKHGQNVSGRRSELLQRAKGVAVVGLRDVQLQNAQDERHLQARSENKLFTPLGEKIPDPATLVSGWTADVKEVPHFTDACVYNYLVLKMNAKRQLKSKVFFQDRHVHSVEYNPISENCSHCLVRCKVIPSLPGSILTRPMAMYLNTCMFCYNFRLGEACNHIGALLYGLVEIHEGKKNGTLASTSQKCLWNNPRKRRLSPKKAEQIFKKMTTQTNPIGSVYQSTVNINRFRERLLANSSSAGWLTFFPRSTTNTEPVNKNACVSQGRLLEPFHVEFMFHDNVDLTSESARSTFQRQFDSLSVTQQACRDIEMDTRGQNNNHWLSARKGRITSSNFGRVYVRKETTPPDNLVNTIMGYSPFDNKFVKWGRDHEPAARRMYTNKMNQSHCDFHVNISGLLIDPKYPHLGSSPDGLVYDSCCNDSGVLEIKCPAAEHWKSQSPLNCAQDPQFFCEVDREGNVVLKRNHPYYYQVQGQMAISGKQWCDSMVDKLNDFYLKAVIPEIYTKRVSRGKPLYF